MTLFGKGIRERQPSRLLRGTAEQGSWFGQWRKQMHVSPSLWTWTRNSHEVHNEWWRTRRGKQPVTECCRFSRNEVHTHHGNKHSCPAASFDFYFSICYIEKQKSNETFHQMTSNNPHLMSLCAWERRREAGGSGTFLFAFFVIGCAHPGFCFLGRLPSYAEGLKPRQCLLSVHHEKAILLICSMVTVLQPVRWCELSLQSACVCWGDGIDWSNVTDFDCSWALAYIEWVFT